MRGRVFLPSFLSSSQLKRARRETPCLSAVDTQIARKRKGSFPPHKAVIVAPILQRLCYGGTGNFYLTFTRFIKSFPYPSAQCEIFHLDFEFGYKIYPENNTSVPLVSG